VDFELLDQAIKIIETQPGTWRQWGWISRYVENNGQEGWCGTAACVAGHIALLAGWTPKWGDDIYRNETGMVQRDGEAIPVSYAAMRALGVDPEQSSANQIWLGRMFRGENNLEAVKACRNVLATVNGVPLKP